MMTEITTSSELVVGSARLGYVNPSSSLLSAEELAELEVAQREVIAWMVRQAKDAGVALTGLGGLLKALTAQIVEAALDEELDEYLGYDKHDPVGRGSGNSRNGTRSKMVVTDNVGAIKIQVPRDRNGMFEPQLVKKRQRRLSDMDAMVLSLIGERADDRGDRRLLRRGLRHECVKGHDQPDRRPGCRRDGHVDESAFGVHLRGDLYRCDRDQSQGWAGP